MKWEKLFAPHIWVRGIDYAEDGHVTNLTKENDLIFAKVQGSEDYSVSIRLNANGAAKMYCSCPYAADGNNCKHMAAVLYSMEEAVTPLPEKNAPSLLDALDHLSVAVLKELLLEQAVHSSRLRERILLLGTGKLSADQQSNWKRDLEAIIEDAEDRDGFIYYEDAYECMENLCEYMDDRLPQLEESGYLLEAFTLACLVYDAAAEADMDDSDGGLTMVFSSCAAKWGSLYEEAGLSERRQMYTLLSERMKQHSDYAKDFLLDAIFEIFEEAEFSEKTMDFIDNELKTAAEYMIEYLLVKRLHLMERLGMTQQVWDEYQKQYRQYPFVRKLEIQKHMACGEYEAAIAVIKESIEIDSKHPGLISGYSETLISIYEKLGNKEAYCKELVRQVFSFHQNDLTYVQKLKALLTAQEWLQLRQKLLTASTIRHIRHELMIAEELWEELLRAITEDEYQGAMWLTKYEKLLKKHYPDETRELWLRFALNNVRYSSSREGYRAAVSLLKKAKKYPGGPERAREAAEELRNQYPRRTALWDELKKAGF